MLYLDSFTLPTDREELNFRFENNTLFYTNNAYPLDIFPQKGLLRVEFEPITLFYGGNGSGKSTLLNLIAERLGVLRRTSFNRSQIFADYCKMCRYSLSGGKRTLPRQSEIITSDGVFDLLLDTRAINDGNERRRETLYEEYDQSVRSGYQMRSLADYDELKRINEARTKGAGVYISNRMAKDIPGRSNGENAFLFFTQKIGENALYLLDEPENSLSAAYQKQLAAFLSDSVRFYHCQFIISSHSPFLLSLREAKIYDLDAQPAAVKKWYELDNMRLYWELFSAHNEEFC